MRPGSARTRPRAIPAYIPRPAANGRIRWHLAAWPTLGSGTSQAVELVKVLVAGVGFEPTKAKPTIYSPPLLPETHAADQHISRSRLRPGPPPSAMRPYASGLGHGRGRKSHGGRRAVRPRRCDQRDRARPAGDRGFGAAVAPGLAGRRCRGAAVQGPGIAGEAEPAAVGAAGARIEEGAAGARVR
jgi:hypothetical protein